MVTSGAPSTCATCAELPPDISTIGFDISGPDPEPQGFMIQYVNQNVVELDSIDKKKYDFDKYLKYSIFLYT